MKSVLISIKAKWCELIASGKKTVEVRKTRPKIETPFKGYIYCTKPSKSHQTICGCMVFNSDELYRHPKHGIKYGDSTELMCCDDEYSKDNFLNGKVIGEFICDKIYDITPHYDIQNFCNQYECGWKIGEAGHCLSFEELDYYLGGKDGYGWHISDLKIYDKPKNMSEFYKKCKSFDKNEWENDDCLDCENPCGNGGKLYLEKPPQSWCYVDEIL